MEFHRAPRKPCFRSGEYNPQFQELESVLILLQCGHTVSLIEQRPDKKNLSAVAIKRGYGPGQVLVVRPGVPEPVHTEDTGKSEGAFGAIIRVDSNSEEMVYLLGVIEAQFFTPA